MALQHLEKRNWWMEQRTWLVWWFNHWPHSCTANLGKGCRLHLQPQAALLAKTFLILFGSAPLALKKLWSSACELIPFKLAKWLKVKSAARWIPGFLGRCSWWWSNFSNKQAVNILLIEKQGVIKNLRRSFRLLSLRTIPRSIWAAWAPSAEGFSLRNSYSWTSWSRLSTPFPHGKRNPNVTLSKSLQQRFT